MVYVERNMASVKEETLTIAMKIFSEFLMSDSREDTFDDDEDLQRQVAMRQKFLNSINTVQLVTKLLGYLLGKPQLEHVLDLVFDVAVKLLMGGNTEIQKCFLESFEAQKSECILGKIHSLLAKKMAVFAKLMIRHNSDKFKTMIDGSVNSNFVKSTDLDYRDVQEFCIKVLNFLQQLCEGHNKDLQNYLRSQQDRS